MVEAAGIEAKVEAVRAAALGQPAQRPPYSVLANTRYQSLDLPPLRAWRETLAEHVAAS